MSETAPRPPRHTPDAGQAEPGPSNGHTGVSAIAEQTSAATPAQQFLCPYCGHISENPTRCDHCKGLFEPLSRQATQNQMGPWQVRDARNPFQPGCSFATLKLLIGRGRVTRNTILRGPTTRQFWSFACNTPGVAVLLGECHSCHAPVKADEYMCSTCNAVLSPPTDRQHLGLAPVKLLPGQATPEAVASSSMAAHQAAASGRSGAHAAPPGVRSTTPARPGPASRPVRQRVPQEPGPRPLGEANRETIRRLRERVRFMTGAMTFAAILIVAMMTLFAVTMLAGNPSLRFGRPAPEKAAPATEPATGGQSATTPVDRDALAPPGGEGADTTELTEAPNGVPDGGEARAEESSRSAEPVGVSTTAGLDPGLAPWAADIAQAGELERKDTVEDLEAAAALLQRVLKEATSAATDAGDAEPSFPLLQARIDRLTERIDRLRLRDMLD